MILNAKNSKIARAKNRDARIYFRPSCAALLKALMTLRGRRMALRICSVLSMIILFSGFISRPWAASSGCRRRALRNPRMMASPTYMVSLVRLSRYAPVSRLMSPALIASLKVIVFLARRSTTALTAYVLLTT